MILQRRATIVANEVRMLRDVFDGTFIVVEGRDDKLFCDGFIDRECCRAVIAQGKQNVEDVVEVLSGEGFAGLVGLVDADFDRIEGRSPPSGIISSTHHDLETMLMASPALDSVLVEFGADDRLSQLQAPVREILLRASFPVGLLRLLSQRNKLNLKFSELTYSNFIDTETLQNDSAAMVKAVLNKSQRFDIDPAMLISEVEQLSTAGYDRWEIVTGDDIIGACQVGLRKVLGKLSAGGVTADQLRGSLRLAYKAEHSNCRVISEFGEWETKNPGFRVLRKFP